MQLAGYICWLVRVLLYGYMARMVNHWDVSVRFDGGEDSPCDGS